MGLSLPNCPVCISRCTIPQESIFIGNWKSSTRRGTQLRIWATNLLREFIIKGFALDDDRIKQAGGGNYLKELLARIQGIRFIGKSVMIREPGVTRE
ncbi:MAG: virulence RhuM family protein [Methanosarcinales archaeon]|nr:virulence RhuM family protein [Methanosarcinales archaeon]